MIGKTLDEISIILKIKNISPNSVSSLEKKLKQIKVERNAKSMLHLGVILSKEKKINKNEIYE